MSTMVDQIVYVTGGVDTHRDTHTAAVVDQLGRTLGTHVFAASPAGYRDLHRWLSSFGTLAGVGVEGTGSWGAGLARHLSSVGVEVREVVRPNRQHRRRHGKSDPADAVAAAKAVLSGDAGGQPRGGNGPVEAIRLLQVARNSAVKQRTQTANQIRGVLITAPAELRASLQGLTLTQITNTAARYRPGPVTNPYQAAKLSLKIMSTRWQQLKEEIKHLDEQITSLVEAVTPTALLDEPGVGIQTAAQLLVTIGDNPDRIRNEAAFAALCGVSPVDASSGLQQRHRLNRGGDRQANAALYRVIIVRLRYHEPTIDYMKRRQAEGKTKKEIIRSLKRTLARQIYRHLKNTT